MTHLANDRLVLSCILAIAAIGAVACDAPRPKERRGYAASALDLGRSGEDGSFEPGCQGTAVSANVIATARHCVTTSAGLPNWEGSEVRLPDGSRVPVSAVRYGGDGSPWGVDSDGSRQSDLAYVIVPSPVTVGGATIAPIGETATQGERMVVVDQVGNRREVEVTSVNGNDIRVVPYTGDGNEVVSVPGDSGMILGRRRDDGSLEQVGVLSGPNRSGEPIGDSDTVDVGTTSFTRVDRGRTEDLTERASRGEIQPGSTLSETEDRRQVAADSLDAANRDVTSARADVERIDREISTASDPDTIAVAQAEREGLQGTIDQRTADGARLTNEVADLDRQRVQELEGVRTQLDRDRDTLQSDLDQYGPDPRTQDLLRDNEDARGATSQWIDDASRGTPPWAAPPADDRSTTDPAGDRANQLGCEAEGSCQPSQSVPSEGCAETGFGCGSDATAGPGREEQPEAPMPTQEEQPASDPPPADQAPPDDSAPPGDDSSGE